MRLRTPPSPRSLTPSEREELLALIDAVPLDATPKHPSVVALREKRERLRDHVPWWAPSGIAYLRVGPVRYGLDLMRALAMTDDWGTDPTTT